jgi:putative tryptophan/tyrosine transport system substrate-binding protein
VRRKGKENEMSHKIVFLALTAILFALCLPAQAQQPAKVPRIGFLSSPSPSANTARNDAFRQGLRDLGYVERKNILIEYRYAEGKLDRLPELAAELVRLKVDVIVTGGSGSTRPANEATNAIPIVMAQDPDPVGNGFISQPGAAWRKHHWFINSCPGAKRKTIGASHGDRC